MDNAGFDRGGWEKARVHGYMGAFLTVLVSLALRCCLVVSYGPWMRVHTVIAQENGYALGLVWTGFCYITPLALGVYIDGIVIWYFGGNGVFFLEIPTCSPTRTTSCLGS